jgi:adenine-specific DNA-methyltransferase
VISPREPEARRENSSQPEVEQGQPEQWIACGPMSAEPQMVAPQLPLGLSEEDPAYLTRRLVTYIGNKRALLGLIRSAVEDVQRRTGRDRLRIMDAFSGSGVVSRMLKQYASELVVNDIEDYARVTSECYLTNRDAAPMDAVADSIAALNRAVDTGSAPAGFIRRLYAPVDVAAIKPEERVFYTPDNARRLDAYRQLIDDEPREVSSLLMGPLLSEASIHANTAGVFKGFYKDRSTGIGKFGGSGADALDRITAQIALEPPILSRLNVTTRSTKWTRTNSSTKSVTSMPCTLTRRTTSTPTARTTSCSTSS